METAVVALRVVLSLAVVLGLLWVMQRRLTKGARSGHAANLVTVVGRQGIGQKASVVVVDVDGKRFVLGVTEQSVNVLHGGEVPVSRAAEFALTLADAGAQESEPEPPLEFRPRNGQSGRLGGSILSPATWQRTALALRQRR